jgi:hypothetical protein
MPYDFLEYIQIIHTRKTSKDGEESKTSFRIDAEDIIAIGAVVVALIVVAGMIWASFPVNKYTIGLASASGATAPIAQITKAKGKHASRTPWIEWIIIVVLVVAFGLYVWATWGALLAAVK